MAKSLVEPVSGIEKLLNALTMDVVDSEILPNGQALSLPRLIPLSPNTVQVQTFTSVYANVRGYYTGSFLILQWSSYPTFRETSCWV